MWRWLRVVMRIVYYRQKRDVCFVLVLVLVGVLIVLCINWQLVSRDFGSYCMRNSGIFRNGTAYPRGVEGLVVVNCIVRPKHAQIDFGKHRSFTPLLLLEERTPCNDGGMDASTSTYH